VNPFVGFAFALGIVFGSIGCVMAGLVTYN
jgi:hypothetical protein